MQTMALTAVVLVGCWAAGYFIAWRWPFVACSACGGSGKRMSPSGEAYGRCRKCRNLDHLKERRRLLARIYGTGR